MRMLLAAALLAGLAAPAQPGGKRTQDLGPGAARCASLAGAGTPRVAILSATRVPAGSFAAAPGLRLPVPGSCRLTAIARPTRDSEIGFELWLPDEWSGRYVQLGNGGFAGNIDHPSLASEIRRGNAAAMTDTGHKADQFDASWALGHPQKIVDYGYRSIKATADAAHRLMRLYYGRAAARRYFVGCSNGGRQALMAAELYPGDWDGILAGSPAVGWTEQLAAFAAIQHRLRSDPRNWIPAQGLASIEQLARASCAPGQVRCKVDVRRLKCSGESGGHCLSPAQAATLELIQSGPAPRPGGLATGFDPRWAAVPGNWDRWILNRDSRAPSDLAFATQAFRYLILDRPGWSIGDFDPARDFARASDRPVAGRRLADVLDAANPDLRRFAARGGKIILYVGLADAVLSPFAGIAYYRNVAARMGGTARAQLFFRLFVVPGMEHCQAGPAPNAFGQAWIAPAASPDPRHDVRLALQAWVERDLAPAALVAAGDAGPGGRPQATRQLRPYPARPGPITRARPPRPR